MISFLFFHSWTGSDSFWRWTDLSHCPNSSTDSLVKLQHLVYIYIYILQQPVYYSSASSAPSVNRIGANLLICLSSVKGLCVSGLQKPHDWKCSQESSKENCHIYVIKATLHAEILESLYLFIFFRLLQTSKIQSTASKSSTAEHLMIHSSKRKSWNYLTAYINWPMETLESRWGAERLLVLSLWPWLF